MKLVRKIFESLTIATDKTTDAVVTSVQVVDTTLKAATDFSHILRQESMKALIESDDEGRMTNEQILEYLERKELLMDVDKKLNELMRK